MSERMPRLDTYSDLRNVHAMASALPSDVLRSISERFNAKGAMCEEEWELLKHIDLEMSRREEAAI